MSKIKESSVLLFICIVLFFWGCDKRDKARSYESKLARQEFIVDYLKEHYPESNSHIKKAENVYEDEILGNDERDDPASQAP